MHTQRLVETDLSPEASTDTASGELEAEDVM